MSAEERRARVGLRQGLAKEARAADPVGAADAVVAFHGTDAASVFLSAWARMEDGDVGAVERALYEDRSLLRILSMRRTMFVAPVETAAVMLAACSRDVAARERKKLVKILGEAGVGGTDPDAWLSEAEEVALGALAEHGEATAPELAGDDPHLATVLTLSPGTKYEAKQKVISRVLSVLGAEGRAIRTRPRGAWTSTQFRWAALETWQPDGLTDHSDDAAARAELARRWLARFGPGTVEDLKWWTGWTLGQTRAALSYVDVSEMEGGLVLADDVDSVGEPESWAALLPALDPTTMGWKERGWYLGDHGPLLFDVNGNAGPTIWWNGRVVGAWAQADDGEIRTHVLDDVGADALAAIEDRAADLQRRVGDAKLSPRARARSQIEKGLLT